MMRFFMCFKLRST